MNRKVLFLFCLVSLFSLCSLYAEPTTGLQIQTPIPNVKIYVDDVYKGETSSSITGINYLRIPLSEGSYTIRCEHPDISTTSEVVKVPSTEGFKRHIINITSKKLVAKGIDSQKTTQTIKIGNLKIISIPSGATIRVDNQKLQVPTDAEVSNVSIGTHDISVSFPSLPPLDISVMLEESQTITITADFENSTIKSDAIYNLNLITSPSGATVFIDNEEVGISPLEDLKLEQGSHDLKIIKDDYKEYNEKINISGNDFKKISLQEIGAKIKLISDGDNSKIPTISSTNNKFTWGKEYYIPSGYHTLSYGNYKHSYNFKNASNYEILIKDLININKQKDYTLETLPGKKELPPEPSYLKEWEYEKEPIEHVSMNEDLMAFLYVGVPVVGALVGMGIEKVLNENSEGVVGGIIGGILGFGGFIWYGSNLPTYTEYKETNIKINLPSNKQKNVELKSSWESECKEISEYNQRLLEKTNLILEDRNKLMESKNKDRGIMLVKDIERDITTEFKINN